MDSMALDESTQRTACSSSSSSSSKQIDDRSFIDKLIDRMSFELHFKGYNFAGIGTKLEERLARGDQGVNIFDSYCREHDLAYVRNSRCNRRSADKLLIQQALTRTLANDANINEKCVAFLSMCFLYCKVAVERLLAWTFKLFHNQRDESAS